MPNTTPFDSKEHHIRLVGSIRTPDSVDYEFRAILDTGAPFTEFSDQFLCAAGLIKASDKAISVPSGLQTQKYGKLILPQMTVFGHRLEMMTVHVSRFENHWGIDALIGLDFFRRFKVTVDYAKSVIVTEALAD